MRASDARYLPYQAGEDYVAEGKCKFPRTVKLRKKGYLQEEVDFQIHFIVNVDNFVKGDVQMYMEFRDDILKMPYYDTIESAEGSWMPNMGCYAAQGFYFWKDLNKTQTKILEKIKKKYPQWSLNYELF